MNSHQHKQRLWAYEHVTDGYCTPKWLSDRVGEFDTDPCTNSRAHIRARTKYMLPDHDGLALPWHGRVWMNYPYSDPLPWMQKLSYERAMCRVTESLVLAKLDPSTDWWACLTASGFNDPCDVWTFKRRVNHDIPPEVLVEMQRKHEAKGRKGKVNTSNNFASALVHHRGLAPRLDLWDVAQLWAIIYPPIALPSI